MYTIYTNGFLYETWFLYYLGTTRIDLELSSQYLIWLLDERNCRFSNLISYHYYLVMSFTAYLSVPRLTLRFKYLLMCSQYACYSIQMLIQIKQHSVEAT